MTHVKGNDLTLTVRMRELCRPPSNWTRALWSVSTQTTLREVLEAARVRRDGVLSDPALLDLQSSASRLVGTDPGVGDDVRRRGLQQLLSTKTVLTPESLAAAGIQAAADDLATNYLSRWKTELANGVKPEALERCARSVVSHLLNLGFSRAAVLDAITVAAFGPAATSRSASDVVDALQALSLTTPSKFVAVMPVARSPLSKTSRSAGWMNGAALSEWMKANPGCAPHPNERFVGAVRVEVDALDIAAAADRASADFQRVLKRATLGAREAILTFGFFWLVGSATRFATTPMRRGVEVASLVRQDQIFDACSPIPAVDRAISLLAELDDGPAAAAATNGWAALESLGMGPAEDGNRAETAIRMTSLVAASFPRAELTTLAYAYVGSNRDPLEKAIRAASTNRERSELMLRFLSSGSSGRFRRVEDTAAAERLQRLIKDPRGTLGRIQWYVELAFKRLYRLRNMVAHGGRTDSIVLEAGISAVAPLAGAAFDRIHHACTSSGTTPLELISLAQLRIALLDPMSPMALASLLERS